MNLKNNVTISLIIPFVIAIIIGIKSFQNGPTSFGKDYFILFSLVFVFWAVTLLIGALVSHFIELKAFELYASVPVQIIFTLGFIYYSFSMKEPVLVDENENMKTNRLMVDYEERLDDSIAKFPNIVRIAYKKLESEFSDPNDFKLTFFGSEKADSLTYMRKVYFSYLIHDTVNLFSVIQVLNDTAKVLAFNKDINDTSFLNTKKRLKTWSDERLNQLSKDVQNTSNNK
jgi:hypothetical protein